MALNIMTVLSADDSARDILSRRFLFGNQGECKRYVITKTFTFGPVDRATARPPGTQPEITNCVAWTTPKFPQFGETSGILMPSTAPPKSSSVWGKMGNLGAIN